ncbi:MAG: putative sulfate exporter family transporter [Gammaproteobacteria bacterium]|nr:putative sulfate exporter family transporter [Gammaproteobacteria bacterium]
MAQRHSLNEDWLALWLGSLIFLLALAPLAGLDLLGWAVKARVWTDLTKALSAVSTAYQGMGGIAALSATWLFLLALLTVAAWLLNARAARFMAAFTVVFLLSYACWLIGHWANIAVTTPADMQKFGLAWSLRLTPEAGYIVALFAGLLIGNFVPRFARWIGEATRAELYIKIAIVLLGVKVGLIAAQQLSLATAVMFRGLAAIIEAYLIYWAVVYFIARRYFRFSREWAAPLASGISICGVSAAMATGAAIRARPVVPIMVSSLVVIFAVVELLILPFLAKTFLAHEPLVAGAWMGLAVKTDGAAVASGAITESLILASAAAGGIRYQEGWILGTTTTVKLFIDIFIGIWAFILAWIWATRIEAHKGYKPGAGEIWARFPKFVLGYVLTFVLMLSFGIGAGEDAMKTLSVSSSEADNFRQLFFVMTFFSIGVVSDFRRLWQEGIGRLAAVYVLALFGFIIWIGLVISWIFFAGVKPPIAGG